MNENQAKEFSKKNVYIGVSKKPYGKTYFARRNFKRGETIMAGCGKIINHQTPHISIGIGVNKHYLPRTWTGRFWNHSCDSNNYIRTRVDGFPDLIALKPIKCGEEITYSYWMTELTWTRYTDESRIRCRCGSRNCKGRILSFSQLSKTDQENVVNKKLCSKYLIDLYKSRSAPVVLNKKLAISLVK